MLEWALEGHNGLVLGSLTLILIVPLLLGMVAYLWLLQGAKIIAAVWVWRRFWAWLRGRGGHQDGDGRSQRRREYEEYISSAEWRRRRQEILRRDRHRCQAPGCRARARDVHHRWYSDPIGREPDSALESLCRECHRIVHGRADAPSVAVAAAVGVPSRRRRPSRRASARVLV